MKRPRVSIVLVAALLLGADIHVETVRVRDGAVPRALVNKLESEDLRDSARAFGLPSTYSASERETEARRLESSLMAVFGDFGAPSSIAPTDASFQIFEVTVGGGPRPAWWVQEPRFVESRKYVYEAQFAKFGQGYLVINTAVGAAEQVVSIGFGLPSADTSSEARVKDAFSDLLDAGGVPKDHPVRAMPIPAIDVPASASQ